MQVAEAGCSHAIQGAAQHRGDCTELQVFLAVQQRWQRRIWPAIMPNVDPAKVTAEQKALWDGYAETYAECVLSNDTDDDACKQILEAFVKQGQLPAGMLAERVPWTTTSGSVSVAVNELCCRFSHPRPCKQLRQTCCATCQGDATRQCYCDLLVSGVGTSGSQVRKISRGDQCHCPNCRRTGFDRLQQQLLCSRDL